MDAASITEVRASSGHATYVHPGFVAQSAPGNLATEHNVPTQTTDSAFSEYLASGSARSQKHIARTVNHRELE